MVKPLQNVTFSVSYLKPTSYSTVFNIPMRSVREDQRHRRRFTRQKRPSIPVMVIIPLNFACCCYQVLIM